MSAHHPEVLNLWHIINIVLRISVHFTETAVTIQLLVCLGFASEIMTDFLWLASQFLL